MRNKVLLGLACTGTLLVGLVLGALLGGATPAGAAGSGAATAAPASTRDYCQFYEHTLANNLHVSVPQLESASRSALQSTVETAYSDGRITKSRETDLLSKVNQLGTHPCATVDRYLAQHHQLAVAHQAIVNAVAAKLHMPPATLVSDLSSGQSVAQIAAAQHVSLADVNAAYLAAVRSQLQAAVSSHTLTQAQADAAYAKVQRAMANGRYPFLESHSGHSSSGP